MVKNRMKGTKDHIRTGGIGAYRSFLHFQSCCFCKGDHKNLIGRNVALRYEIDHVMCDDICFSGAGPC